MHALASRRTTARHTCRASRTWQSKVLAILPRSFVPGDLVKMKGLIEATAQHLAGRIDDQPWQSLVERQIELAIDGIDAGAQILRRREFDVTAEVAREACAIGALLGILAGAHGWVANRDELLRVVV
jgi:hypothetical protein